VAVTPAVSGSPGSPVTAESTAPDLPGPEPSEEDRLAERSRGRVLSDCLRALAPRVRDAVLEAHARQELPFEILAARLAREDGLDPASLIQVYFTLQNPLRQLLELPDIATQAFGNVYREGQPVLPIDHTWLSLMLKERPSGITGSCIYKSNLFKRGAVTHLMKDFTMILANAVAAKRL